jgi:hypothetical protein
MQILVSNKLAAKFTTQETQWISMASSVGLLSTDFIPCRTANLLFYRNEQGQAGSDGNKE